VTAPKDPDVGEARSSEDLAPPAGPQRSGRNGGPRTLNGAVKELIQWDAGWRGHWDGEQDFDVVRSGRPARRFGVVDVFRAWRLRGIRGVRCPQRPAPQPKVSRPVVFQHFSSQSSDFAFDPSESV